MASILDRVVTITAKTLSIEEKEITPASSFTETLNADSLDMVELIMALEEEFGTEGTPFEISDEDAESIKTIKDAVDYINGRGYDEEA